MALKDWAGQIAQAVHHYVQTPKNDLFFAVGVSSFGERSDVVEDSYHEPHPQIVFSGEEL